MGRLSVRIQRWMDRRKYIKSGQTCRIFCPGCRQDLISRVGYDGTKVRDRTHLGENYVKYACGVCKTYSTWDFDNYPVPVLIKAIQHRIWIQQTGSDGITRTVEKVSGPGHLSE